MKKNKIEIKKTPQVVKNTAPDTVRHEVEQDTEPTTIVHEVEQNTDAITMKHEVQQESDSIVLAPIDPGVVVADRKVSTGAKSKDSREQVIVANAESVNVREKPHKNSTVRFVAAKGDKFYLLETTGAWSLVESDVRDKFGYIMTEFTKKVD